MTFVKVIVAFAIAILLEAGIAGLSSAATTLINDGELEKDEAVIVAIGYIAHFIVMFGTLLAVFMM